MIVIPTLFYNPGIRILISTSSQGTLDVTDDITEGSLNLNVKAPHKLTFSLSNHRRKYDGVFMPNDRVICRLKRLNWLQVFAGYLDQVPFFTVYPTDVKLDASCTLKRLQYRYWDPGASTTVSMLRAWINSSDNLDLNVITGGMTTVITRILTDIADWNQDTIHIGRIPTDWVNKVDEIWAKLSPGFSVPASLLGIGPTVGGNQATDMGVDVAPNGVGKGYGSLPFSSGNLVTTMEGRTGLTVVTGERRDAPQDEWWCAMHWPFAKNESGDLADGYSNDERLDAINHWKGTTVLVVNPQNNKSIVLRPSDWGPSSPNAVISMSDTAAAAIGAQAGTFVLLKFGGVGAVYGEPGKPAGDSGDLGTASVPNTQGGLSPTYVSPQSVTWAPADNLKANTRAARDFILANWPSVPAIYGWRANDAFPDHPNGVALDVAVSTEAATGDAKALGNSVAMWFMSNPNVFGVKTVIWYDRVASPDIQDGAWRLYTSNSDESPSQLHMNHVHISFKDGITSAGPTGSPMAGAAATNFDGGFSSEGPAGGATLLQTQNWNFDENALSNTLAGERALMNDQNIFDDISKYVDASMRSFCSAPNGDFIAWFPDYFGIYGTAGKVVLRAIEMQDWGMTWTDRYLITHQYTAGSYNGAGSTYQEQTDLLQEQTSGVVSVEHPEVMEALLNVSRDDPQSAGWTNTDAILQRFGARPNFNSTPALSYMPKAEFWYAMSLFMQNWAAQFSAQVPLTFMPELFPGMLLVLPDYGIQFYVDGVTHTWNLKRGGGFYTQASITSPSATDGTGFKGLVRGGTS